MNLTESLSINTRATSMPNPGEIDIQIAESLQILRLALNDLVSLSTVDSTFTRAVNHLEAISLDFTTAIKLSAESGNGVWVVSSAAGGGAVSTFFDRQLCAVKTRLMQQEKKTKCLNFRKITRPNFES